VGSAGIAAQGAAVPDFFALAIEQAPDKIGE
jgi:hypothetical protein